MDVMIVFVLLFAAFVIGAIFAGVSCNSHWKEEAVKRGYAQYNAKTGEWEWIEKETR